MLYEGEISGDLQPSIVFDDRVECGDWKIATSSLEEAVLFETRQMFLRVFVLRLVTKSTTYQFGFNPWCRIDENLPFDVERRHAKLGSTPFRMAVRIALFLLVAYWLWRRIGGAM